MYMCTIMYDILVTDRVYNKRLSSQCNVTAQIEQVQDRNEYERGRFGALKSDSTHHFFRNACTKSGSLRFPVFRLLTDFVCLYTYEF
jgi:hypothetical protein